MKHWALAAWAAAIGFALPAAAFAQACGSLAEATSVLAQKYGEHPLPGDWRAQDGHRIVFTGSAASGGHPATWTMLIVDRGVACTVISGTVSMPPQSGKKGVK